jgi:T4 bacteriophage base plate protein
MEYKMNLPKITYPLNEIEFKSLNKKFTFRPMLVKEEKILLIAKQSENENDIFTAIKQVVNNCLVEGQSLNIEELPLFELEYAFLRLRIQSIGDSIELSYKDNEDELEYKFNINLEDIVIKYPEVPADKIINISKDMGLTLKYPPASLYDNKEFLNTSNPAVSFDEILYSSIDTIFDGEKLYLTKEVDRKELEDFISNIPSTIYKEIQKFFENIPHMEYVIEYKNKKGTDRKIELRTLNDFFIL